MDGIYAIKCGVLIDGTGEDARSDVLITVRDSRIVDVSETSTTPQGMKIIDASGKTVIPGLIDGHVHLQSDPNLTEFQKLFAPDAQLNLRAAKNARRTLEAGFTSILGNCGYGEYADLFLKEAIDNGWLPGPRLWTSGPSVTSTLRRGIYRKYNISPNPLSVADGCEQIRKIVRGHIATGVDWIKVLATYDIGSPTGEPSRLNLTADEIHVIVEEAHAQNKLVKVHLEGTQTTKDALQAGIDIVLHGFFLDGDDVELMRTKGIPLIPTLAWFGECLQTDARGLPTWYLRRVKRYDQVHQRSFRRALREGVTIAAGTDCSGGGSVGDFLRHGENAKEMEYLVRSGMTPMDAIVAGTKNVALAFGFSDIIGTAEPGKLADFTILNGNPLSDITILQDKRRIDMVIKDGKVAVENGVSRPFSCEPLRVCASEFSRD